MKAKQALSSATKQVKSGMKRIGGNEGVGKGGGGGGGGSVSRESSPAPPQTLSPSITVTKERKKGRGKIVGLVNEAKELKTNPKVRQLD